MCFQEIHKKVMSLQFSECHTKIRHVDAHATLSDGVVVQVMGELSNNGQPMRKFMQTFVLAPEVSSCKIMLNFKWPKAYISNPYVLMSSNVSYIQLSVCCSSTGVCSKQVLCT